MPYAAREDLSKEIEFMPPGQAGTIKNSGDSCLPKKDYKFKIDKEDLEDLAEKTFGYTGAICPVY